MNKIKKNMNKINVLSLFDGLSCGQIALKKLGIGIEKYYASEIDKYAIQVCQDNFPETIQLGDIENWRDWDIDWSKINLVQGGSPCQGFSFAGKQLNFDDPRSKLFFVFADIVEHIKKANPNVKFLLENVRMKKEYQDVISERMGVEPININSSLVSAQNRNRFYWTNIQNIKQPKDKGILLKDLLEKKVEEKYYYKGKPLYEKIKKDIKSKDLVYQWRRHYVRENKKGVVPTLTANMGTGGHNVPIIKDNKGIRKLTPRECARLQTIPDDYSFETVSNSQKYKMIGNGWTVDVIAHIYN